MGLTGVFQTHSLARLHRQPLHPSTMGPYEVPGGAVPGSSIPLAGTLKLQQKVYPKAPRTQRSKFAYADLSITMRQAAPAPASCSLARASTAAPPQSLHGQTAPAASRLTSLHSTASHEHHPSQFHNLQAGASEAIIPAFHPAGLQNDMVYARN